MCTRGSGQAPSRGPSTSPLNDAMIQRKLAVFLFGPALFLTIGLVGLNRSGWNYERAIYWSGSLYATLLLVAVAVAALCFLLLRRSPQLLRSDDSSCRSVSSDLIAAVGAATLTILPLFVAGDAIVVAFATTPGQLDGNVVRLFSSNSTRNSCTKILSVQLSDSRTVSTCYETDWRGSLGPSALDPGTPVTLFVRAGHFGTVVDAVRTR